MPWKISKSSNCPKSKPYGVIKEGETSARWCHSTEESAKQQVRALYAQENKEMTEDNATEEKMLTFAYGATSFREAEERDAINGIAIEISVLNNVFQNIVGNIMTDDSITDKAAAVIALVDEYSQRLQAIPRESKNNGFVKSIKSFFGFSNTEEKRTGPAMKRENGIDFPARDYAYVPDPQKPSTWKLRLTERPGKVTIRQLGRAAAALSTGGFRGKKAQIPKEALSSVKRRVRQEYRKLGVKDADIPNSVKIDDAQPRRKSSFFVLKDRNNEYRWFSVYSNNYRDDDYPPEIITAASHRAFVKAVSDGVFDYPELWLWHFEHPVGDADWLDFTEGGLALASGTFRKGYEETAEKLANYGEPILVSHGMPTEYIVRDQDDPSIIWFHVTKEISPLPAWAAANKLTGFVVMKETEAMPISDDKKSFLQEVLPDGLFDELNQAVTMAEGKAAETGRESKETSEPEETEEEVQYVTAVEVADALGEVLRPMIDGFSAMSERVASLEANVKELTVAKEEREREEAPAAVSLTDLLAGQLTKEAEATDAETKDAPRETPDANEGTGFSIIDQLIAGSIGG